MNTPNASATAKVAHTPGPWIADTSDTYGCFFVHAENGRSIARSGSDHGRFSEGEENDANARLIAAAPELLAALHHVITASEDANFSEAVALVPELESVLDSVRAAIAKAEGRA